MAKIKKEGIHKIKKGQPYIPKKKEGHVNYYEDVYLASKGYYDYEYTGGGWSCHIGNTKVLTSSRGEGGTLYIGGWSRGAYHSDEMTVIDLASERTPLNHTGNWYSIGIDDFKVPKWSAFFWESMAMLVYNELQSGDVLVACQGGHGRSGMFVSVIAYMLRRKRHIRILERELLICNPLDWIREIHCDSAVETLAQERMVINTCISVTDNPDNLLKVLERINERPVYKTKSSSSSVYGEVVAEWIAEPDEEEVFLCPICTEEFNTLIEALMHCNTATIRHCPVCLKKHDLPVNAYECHKVPSPIKFEEEEI